MHMPFLNVLKHIHAASKRCKQYSSAMDDLGVKRKSTCEANWYPRICTRRMIYDEGRIFAVPTNLELLHGKKFPDNTNCMN